LFGVDLFGVRRRFISKGRFDVEISSTTCWFKVLNICQTLIKKYINLNKLPEVSDTFDSWFKLKKIFLTTLE
jgi:hypothetical protein